MLERTINNAPTSNTKQAAMNGDMQHMLAMMQSPYTSSSSAIDRIAERAGNLNNIVAGNAPATTQSFMNTTQPVPKTNAPAAVAVQNATVNPAPTMQQELADMQAAAPATPSPAVSTTQTKTEQAVAPAVTIPARQVNSYEQYVNDMYEAERQAALSALEAEYAAAIGELERQKAAISPMYQNARNQTAGVNAKETQAMNEMFNAAGLSSGGRAQGAIAQSNVLQSELGALQQAEAQALAEIESQRTQVSAQYQARVREAIMNNEMQKAAALYEEAIRYDNELVKAAKEAAASREDMAKTMASIGDFSGYAALGYTPDQIAALEAAYIKANTPKHTGGVVKEKEPEYKDYYAILKEAGVKDADYAYQLLYSMGVKGDELMDIAAGYEDYINTPVGAPGGGNDLTYADVANDLAIARKNGDSSAELNLLISGALANGIITTQEAAQLRGAYVGGR